MDEPHLIPALAALRDNFNRGFPGRSKKNDGWIGDTAHQRTTSDHNPDETGKVPIRDADSSNEVHAIDVTAEPWMEGVVQRILARCRSGAEDRLRYIIFKRRIWRASNGWKQEAYTGPSPHDEHAHFSASYESAKEADAGSWHLEAPTPSKSEDDMPSAEEIATAVWTYDVDTAKVGRQSAAGYLTTENARSGELRTVIEPEQAESLSALHTAVNNLTTLVEQNNARLDALVNRLPAEPPAS